MPNPLINSLQPQVQPPLIPLTPPGNQMSPLIQDFQNRGNQIGQAVSRGADALQQSAQGTMNPLQAGARLAETGLNTAGAVAGGANDIVKNAISPITQGIGNAIGSIPGADKVANSGIVKTIEAGGNDLLSKYNALKQAHPQAFQDISSVMNIVGTLLANKNSPNINTQTQPQIGNSIQDVSNGKPSLQQAVDQQIPGAEAQAAKSGATSIAPTPIQDMTTNLETMQPEAVKSSPFKIVQDSTNNLMQQMDSAIQRKDIPESSIYADKASGLLTPDRATAVIDNIVNQSGGGIRGATSEALKNALAPFKTAGATAQQILQTTKNAMEGYIDKSGAMIIDPTKRNLGANLIDSIKSDPATQAWMKVVPTPEEQKKLDSYGKIPALDKALQLVPDLIGSLITTASNPAQAANRFYNFVNAVAGKVDKSVVQPLLDLMVKKASAAGPTQTIYSKPGMQTHVQGGQPSVAVGTPYLPAWTSVIPTPMIPGATPISDKEFVDDPYLDHTNVFTTDYSIDRAIQPDDPHVLTLGADNSYDVYSNGQLIYSDPTEFNYKKENIRTIDIPNTKTGPNTLQLVVKNWRLAANVPGSPQTNPTGTWFKLDVAGGSSVPPTPPPPEPTPTPSPTPNPTPTPTPNPTPTPTPSPLPPPPPQPPPKEVPKGCPAGYLPSDSLELTRQRMLGSGFLVKWYRDTDGKVQLCYKPYKYEEF